MLIYFLNPINLLIRLIMIQMLSFPFLNSSLAAWQTEAVQLFLITNVPFL